MPGSAKDTCASEERRRHKDRWAGNRDRQCLFGAPFPFSTLPSPSRSVSGVVMSEGVGTLSYLPLLPNHDGETSLTVKAKFGPVAGGLPGFADDRTGQNSKKPLFFFFGGGGCFLSDEMCQLGECGQHGRTRQKVSKMSGSRLNGPLASLANLQRHVCQMRVSSLSAVSSPDLPASPSTCLNFLTHTPALRGF